MRISLLLVVGLATLPAWAIAGPPDIVNSKLTIEPVGASLASSLDSLVSGEPGPHWIGWSVPAVEGDRLLCCSGQGDLLSQEGACSLEDRARHFVMSKRHGPDRPLAPVREMAILARAERSRVGEVRIYSDTCRLDAGGRAVTWLEGADAEQSVDWLTTLIGQATDRGTPEDLADQGLMALALHRSSAADLELATLADSGRAESLREEAIFWLGEARGQAGLEALDRLLEIETNAEIKTHVAFALTLNRSPGAMQRLTTLARQDADPEVRGEALFWLGQEGGTGAVATIRRAVESDSSREVREQAVFALSQLPDGGGTDLLLEIVRDRSQNPSIRQAALFWLAQSEDDRALDLISGLLK